MQASDEPSQAQPENGNAKGIGDHDVIVSRARHWLQFRGLLDLDGNTLNNSLSIDSGSSPTTSCITPPGHSSNSCRPQSESIIKLERSADSAKSTSSTTTNPRSQSAPLKFPKSWLSDHRTELDALQGEVKQSKSVTTPEASRMQHSEAIDLQAECSKVGTCSTKWTSPGKPHTPPPKKTRELSQRCSSSPAPSKFSTTIRRKEACEDRKRARARAAGEKSPTREAVRRAQWRAAWRRWSDDIKGERIEESNTRTELLQKRDARLRRFLEMQVQHEKDDKEASCRTTTATKRSGDLAQEQCSSTDLSSLKLDDVLGTDMTTGSVDLSFLEAEAEALEEDFCTPSPPPQPCPLPAQI